MPDVDGIELLRFLRGNDAFAAVPVVSEFFAPSFLSILDHTEDDQHPRSHLCHPPDSSLTRGFSPL